MDVYLTVKEVMEILKVSRTAVNNWMSSGKLKFYKVGRLVRVKEDDLEKFIQDQNK